MNFWRRGQAMSPDRGSDRRATFKEAATLLEYAPECVWSAIAAVPLKTAPYDRYYSADQFREFIALNLKLFGPGKQEL